MKPKIYDHQLDVFFAVAEVLQRCGSQTGEPLRDRFASQGSLKPQFSVLMRRLELLDKALCLGRAAGYLRGGPVRGWELTPEGEDWHREMRRRIAPFCCSIHLRPEWQARFWKLRSANQLPAAA